jgi:hypothetical protein
LDTSDTFDPKKTINTLKASMMLNQHPILAKTQLDQKGKNLFMVARTLAPSCTDKEFEKIVREVAIHADILK